MELQYQESNGTWYDCGDRSQEFLDKCLKYNKSASEVEIRRTLLVGETVSWDSEWYALCRDKPVEVKYTRRVRERKVCRECGEAGFVGSHPFSTMPDGNICDDCL